MLVHALRLVLTVTVFVAVFLIATPGRASAHADLVGTAPGNGEHLDAAPAEVRLRFTERVNLIADAVMLLDADGNRRDTTVARLDGETDVVLDVPAGLGDGVYTVVWRMVSADSHPVHGVFVFSVGTASAVAAADAGARAGVDPVLGAVFWTFRLLGYAALAVFAGGVAFVWLCWPAGWHSRRTRGILLAGWGTSLACAVAALVLQGPYGAGATLAGVADLALLRDTVASEYGGYVLARLTLLAAAGALFLLARRVTGRVLTGVRAAAVAVAVVAAPATWAGTGHANASGPLPMAATTLHLIAMMSWLGGLALLFSSVLSGPADDPPSGTARTLSRFSRLAMVCVGVLVVTGVYQAWQGLGGLAALAGSSYGGLLAFKLAILGVLLAFGAISRSIVQRYHVSAAAASPEPEEVSDEPAATGPVAVRVATRTRAAAATTRRTNGIRAPVKTTKAGARPPRTTRGAEGPGRSTRRAWRAEQALRAVLRRRLHLVVGIEAGIAVAILALTSALVATPPGRPDIVPVRLDTAVDVRPASPLRVDLALDDGGTVHIEVDPLRVGPARMTIQARDGSGGALDVPEVRAAISLPERDLGPLTIALERVGPGSYTAAAVTIPFAGTWQLHVTVRTTEIDQINLVTDVPVS